MCFWIRIQRGSRSQSGDVMTVDIDPSQVGDDSTCTVGHFLHMGKLLYRPDDQGSVTPFTSFVFIATGVTR
jgi:hypothetical protein